VNRLQGERGEATPLKAAVAVAVSPQLKAHYKNKKGMP